MSRCMHRRAAFIGLVAGLVACGPVERAATPDASPVAVPVVVEPSQLPSPVEPAAAPPVPELALLEACTGTHLSLSWMYEEKSCAAPATALSPLPPGAIATRIDPPSITLRAGEAMQAMVVIENTTDAPLSVDYKLSCIVAGLKTSIVDARGERADVITKCGYGSGCGGRASRVTLDPKGDARIRFEVRATFVEEGADCDAGPPQPMKPGTYEVRARMPFGPPDAAATLTVTEP